MTTQYAAQRNEIMKPKMNATGFVLVVDKVNDREAIVGKADVDKVMVRRMLPGEKMREVTPEKFDQLNALCAGMEINPRPEADKKYDR